MLKYRVGGWGKNLIEPVEIERETESSVWVKGSRLNKKTSCHVFFDSWEEAHSYLLEKAQRRVESSRLQLEREKGKLGNIKGLKPL